MLFESHSASRHVYDTFHRCLYLKTTLTDLIVLLPPLVVLLKWGTVTFYIYNCLTKALKNIRCAMKEINFPRKHNMSASSIRWSLRVCVIKGIITFTLLRSVPQNDMRCTEQIHLMPYKKWNSLIGRACVGIMSFNFIETKGRSLMLPVKLLKTKKLKYSLVNTLSIPEEFSGVVDTLPRS